jgi:glyoxylase-like metal-dependent hydrolase (beta-lactamase superfamily II)
MSPWFPRWHLGAPCLVIETEQGLALVDTGLGLHDYARPALNVRLMKLDFGVHPDPDQAAVRQLARLGYPAEAVKHIVQTHLHFDHAGGLPDFPHAQVHLHRREYEAMLSRRPFWQHSFMELAYDHQDVAHGPRWVLYDRPDTEWLGLPAIRLPFTPEMYLVPLFGHTAGHCGVALREGEGWLFQCADALPTNAEFDLVPPWVSRLMLGKHVARLKAWSAAHPEVRLLAGHMWSPFFGGQN